ncbi:MAG: diaminopimelate decarboxylase [Bacteroidota bacterium]|nr:diaminopimelate decarboxylase [Bacteroidota bacterium]
MNDTTFLYRDQSDRAALYCEDVSLDELASQYGTPLYVYSKAQILSNFRTFSETIKRTGSRNYVSYAIKANSNFEILKLLAAEGAGASVVSGGELRSALKAGFDPAKITFDGPGKTDEEIQLALQSNIVAIDVESLQELHVINDLAKAAGLKAGICIRVNPHIDAKSHPYISTGLLENKFGIAIDDAAEVFRIARSLENISIVGLHSHIGSQITELSPFIEAAESIVEFVTKLRVDDSITLQHINFGGGQAIDYHHVVSHPLLDGAETFAEPVPSFQQIADSIFPILSKTGCSINFEPGRAIVANSGALLTKVLYTKSNGDKHFVIVDAGMSDLIRPSLYHAYHEIVPLTITANRGKRTADIVGPICETGDFLAHDRLMPVVDRGEKLAVLSTGAYGYVLASNYNMRPRAAEILVSGSSHRIIRQRERLEDIIG